MTTPELIKQMRIKKGLTRNQVAERMGYENIITGAKTIWKWESGNKNISLPFLIKMAKALKTNIKNLLS